MSSTIKLCKDCKHLAIVDGQVAWAKCHHPEIGLMDVNYVNGAKRYWTAQLLRETKSWKTCGPSGKYWEPSNGK